VASTTLSLARRAAELAVASMTLELRIFVKPWMVLSALLFIGKTCEVVWTNLDLGNPKTKILGENVKKAEST